MPNAELNFCIRPTLDRKMSPAYSRTIMSLAKMYDTDCTVVTMQLLKSIRMHTSSLYFVAS